MRSIGPERTAEGARHRVPFGRRPAQLSTAAGRAAKAFVDALLKPGDEMIICTTKPDKYDRYLADVFIEQVKGSEGSISQLLAASKRSEHGSALNSHLGAAAPIFLNNALLSAGHAVRYDGGAKEE